MEGVGDLAGFVAATYQRGVDFVQIPTTLLAQVDSSVGGKTAVNHPAGKNMIGAFYQPRCVVIDTRVLESLPHREYLAGVAEVVKYGAITDVDFFADLESNVEALRARNLNYLATAIQRSVELKAQVVAADEREGGLRAILNFGHTFGHAIEQLSGYGVWLHGEAVSIGMVMAAQLCASMGLLTDSHAQRIRSLLDQAGLPVNLVEAGSNERLQVDEFIEVMAMDKKAVDGQIRLVLLDRLGHAVVTSDYDPNLLRHVVEQHL